MINRLQGKVYVRRKSADDIIIRSENKQERFDGTYVRLPSTLHMNSSLVCHASSMSDRMYSRRNWKLCAVVPPRVSRAARDRCTVCCTAHARTRHGKYDSQYARCVLNNM